MQLTSAIWRCRRLRYWFTGVCRA